MKTHFRWIWLSCLCLLVGAAAGGGLAFYFYYFDQGFDRLFKDGEVAFQRGRNALAASQFDAAQQDFHAALVMTEKLFEDLERQRPGLKEAPAEEQERFRRREGEAYWLKMRALRGHSLSKALAAGQHLPAIEGVAGNQPVQLLAKFPVTHLPSEDQRREAVICLRQAALRLAGNEEVLREAVAAEIQMEPLQWYFVHVFAANLLQESINPRDERARYLMARYEYEQPLGNPANPAAPPQPTPEHRRSRERMLLALEHIEKLKAVERIPRWRTLFLEAEVHGWLMAYYRRPEARKPALEAQAAQTLRTLLLDETAGALARTQREGEDNTGRLPGLSRLDFEGILGLHQMALDLAIDDCRRSEQAGNAGASGNADAVQKSFSALASLPGKLLSANPPGSKLGRCCDVVVQSAVRAQPFLARERPEPWQKQLTALQALIQQATERKAGHPGMYVRVADLWAREAELAGKAGNQSRQDDLRKQAIAWVEEGVKSGQARKWPPAQMAGLHETAARLKAVSGGKWADLAPHLQVMRDAGPNSVKATAYLLEGAYAEREGRLEKARNALEMALQLQNRGDTARRAHTVLAHLYLALGQPERALGSLREIDRIYEQWEQLSEEEKHWVFEFIRDSRELAYLQLQAHLACALDQYRQVARAAQAKEARDHLLRVKAHEQEAVKVQGKFQPRSPLERAARLQWVKHFAATERFDLADNELSGLRRDYPESLPVLKMELKVLASRTPSEGAAVSAAQTKEAVRRADERIQQFIRDYPQDVSARLYWAEWLLSSGRSDQAAAYLENPANFPGNRDDARYQRLRSVVHLLRGDADKVREAAQNLPREPVVDVALIQAAGSLEDKQKQIHEAMNRYERNGLFRCWNAGMALARRDYSEAAREYLRAVECTQVKKAARQGLRDALMALAQEEPEKARTLSAQLLQEYPAEPALLLGFAHACMLLNQLGNPADRSEQIKDMATALHAYEAAVTQQGQSAAAALTKARFWMMAQMPERARPEVQRALQVEPKQPEALLLAVQLCMAGDDPSQLGRAAGYLQTLRGLQPQAPLPRLLSIQLQCREGNRADALAECDELLKAHPRFPAAYALHVEILTQAGDQEWVAQVIRRWCEACPGDLNARTAQVRWHAQRGQPASARQVLTETVALLDRETTDGPRQVKHTEPTASQANKEAAKTAIRLSLVQGLIQGQAYDEAEKWLQEVLEVQRGMEAAHLLLGEVHLARLSHATGPAQRKPHAVKARDAFSAVYQQRKGHFVAGNNLAWLLATELNDPDEAYRIAQEVRQNRYTKSPLPGDQLPAAFLDTLGLVYERLETKEQAAEARDLFDAACRRHSQDARMYLYLGQAHLRLRDLRKAEQMFASAAALAQPQARSPLSSQQKQAVLAAVAKARQQSSAR